MIYAYLDASSRVVPSMGKLEETKRLYNMGE